MPRSRRAYYWLIVFLIPCMLGIDQCGTRLFLTGEVTENSPTEPCVEYILTPTPGQLIPSSGEPEPQNTPLIQDGEVVVVVTPVILPTPTFTSQYIVNISTVVLDPGCLPSFFSPSTGTIKATSGSEISLSASSLFTCYYGIYVDGIVVSWGVPGGGYTLIVTGDHNVYMCIDINPC